MIHAAVIFLGDNSLMYEPYDTMTRVPLRMYVSMSLPSSGILLSWIRYPSGYLDMRPSRVLFLGLCFW